MNFHVIIFNETFDKIMAADGFVIGSPVYIYQVTAQLKNWIDRLGNTIHCQTFIPLLIL